MCIVEIAFGIRFHTILADAALSKKGGPCSSVVETLLFSNVYVVESASRIVETPAFCNKGVVETVSRIVETLVFQMKALSRLLRVLSKPLFLQ